MNTIFSGGRWFSPVATLILALLSWASSASAQTAEHLLNLNLGSGTKTGLAAIGNGTSDSWNLISTNAITNVAATYTYYSGSPTVPTVTWGTFSNLVWATGSNTTISVTVTNLTTLNHNGTDDVMFDSYLQTSVWAVMSDYNEETMEYITIYSNPTVLINGLPEGTYDLLVYGLGGSTDDNQGFSIKVGTNAPSSTKTTTWFSPLDVNWTEDYHYVKFTNLTVNAGEAVKVSLSANYNYYHLINGIQIVDWSSTNAPALPGVTFSPASGTTVPTDVTLYVTNHSGATIYYTTDGSTPTTNSSVYSSAISLSAATTIKAFATESGYSPCSVSSATYPLPELPNVTFDPASGTSLPTTVTLYVTNHTNATIYYTLDGSTPTTSSSVYSSPISLTTNSWSFSANVVPSMTSYTTPSGSTITYSSELSGSSRYAWKAFDHSVATQDNNHWSANTASSEWVAIQFPSTRYVNKYALQCRANSGDGPKNWTFEGWDGSQYVTLDTRSNETKWYALERREYVCTNTGGFIKYRLNISQGNASSVNTNAYIVVGEVEMFEAKTTLTAFATETNHLDSGVTFASYYAPASSVPQVAPTPNLTPAEGGFYNDIQVTIDSSLSGASYKYSTDGTNWLDYTNAVTLSQDTIFAAYTTKSGYTDSAIRTNFYAFEVAPTTISPNGGYFTNSVEVTLTNATSGATLQYSLNGGTLTSYTGPLTLTNSTTLTAVASKTGYTSSTGSVTFAAVDANAPPGQLLNVNFGSGTKTGYAAVGNSSSDVWNVIGASALSTNSSLQWANASNSPVTVVVSELAYSSGTSHSDPMMSTYIYGDYYGSPEVRITGLSSNVYDFYFLAQTGPSSYQTARFGVEIDSTTTWSDWTSAIYDDEQLAYGPLVEGVHFVAVRNVVVPDGTTVKIHPAGSYEYGFINGMQIMVRGPEQLTLPPPNMTPAAGSYTTLVHVQIQSPWVGATNRYTLDGSTWVTGSSLVLESSATVIAQSVRSGYNDSSYVTNSYTLNLPPTSALLNFNFGTGNKVGYGSAAFGLSSNDAWNLITNTASGTFTNLMTADSNACSVTLTVTNLPSNSSNGHSDTMLGTYLCGDAIDWNTSESIPASLVISNLAGGAYDFYFYAVGSAPASEYESFTLTIGANTTSTKATGTANSHASYTVSTRPLQENLQYVVFTNLTVTSGQSVFVNMGAGMYTHILNGLQVFNRSATNGPTHLPSVTFDPASGATVPTNVTLSVSGHTNASIYYTLDGSTPTTNSSVYSSAISLTNAVTITAFATEVDCLDSSVSSASYVLPQLPNVTFDPGSGATVPTNVTLSVSGHTNATIYYTTDGSTPTTNSSVYSSAISLTTATTVKAFATKALYLDSAVSAATYTLPQLPAVTFSPPSGATVPTNVTLAVTGHGDATIYYTLDGATPTTNSSVYSGAISLTATTTVKAFATKAGYVDSGLSSAQYNLLTAPTPDISPAGGDYANDVEVTISSSLSGAGYRYTTNGTDWLDYTGAFTLGQNTTLHAYTTKSGYADSAICTNSYTFTVASTSINPNGGSFTSSVEVTLTNATSGATIQYSLNGGTLTSYTGPLTLTSSTTLSVVASKSGYTSSTNSATFAPVVNAPPSVGMYVPEQNAWFASGSHVTLVASASVSNGVIARVEFYESTNLLCTSYSAPYGTTFFSAIWSNVPPGNYSVTAKAIDTLNDSTTSAPRTISVVATNTRPLYILTDLGCGRANAINAFGQVAGWSTNQGGAFVWTPDSPNQTNGAFLSLGSGTWAYGLNNGGAAIGQSYYAVLVGTNEYDGTPSYDSRLLSSLWPPSFNGINAVCLTPGFLEATNPGTSCSVSVNSSGISVGSLQADSYYAVGGFYTAASPVEDIYTPLFATFEPAYSSYPYPLTTMPAAINNVGCIVGASNGSDPNAPRESYPGQYEPYTRAFLWHMDNGSTNLGMINLGCLNGTFTSYLDYSWAYAVNDSNYVVGISSAPFPAVNMAAYRAFLWTPTDAAATNGALSELGVLGYRNMSQASAINNRQQIVGSSWKWDGSANTDARAFIHDATVGLRDLNQLIPTNSGWIALTAATGINDSGQIVGYGLKDNVYYWAAEAFLLTPINSSGFTCGGFNVTIINPTNTQRFELPTNVTIDAVVTPTNTPINRVEFYDGPAMTNLIGTAYQSPYSITWTSVPRAVHTLVAKAYDTDGNVAYSPLVTITPTNDPPVVAVTADNTTVMFGGTNNLSGSVTDDGLPLGAALTYAWSKTSGPGSVTFGSPSALNTTATFSYPGIYVLRLTASDTELTGYAEITIEVQVQNEPPVVDAGPDQAITVSACDLNGMSGSNFVGKVVVCYDEWHTILAGFQGAPVGGPRFCTNLAKWFCPGKSGKLLLGTNFKVYDEDVFSRLVITLTQAGYTLDRGIPTDLNKLLEYDGVLVAGDTVDNTLLTQYVNAGGNVYISCGTNPNDSYTWIDFMQSFGLGFIEQDPPDVGHGAFPVDSTHPLLEGVPSLYFWDGRELRVLDQANPNTAIILSVTTNNFVHNFMAVSGQNPPPGTILEGFAADDGFPVGGQLTTTWSKVSGPGKVFFEDEHQTNTVVRFTAAGTYVLRLTADDGDLTVFDEITIQVNVQECERQGELLNLNLGSGNKLGPVAVGIESVDRWNLLSTTNEINNVTFTNLFWANGARSLVSATLTNIRAEVANGVHIGTNASTDEMYRSFVSGNYEYADENLQGLIQTNSRVDITRLASGVYSFYVYGHGVSNYDIGKYAISVFDGANTVSVSETLETIPSTDFSLPLTNGIHYVIFSNIRLGSNHVARIHLMGVQDPDNPECLCKESFLSGVQILRAPKLPAVEFTPPNATATVPTNVTLSVPDHTNATIYYTLDGSTPTTNSSVYSSAISLTNATTITAFATASDYNDSDVSSASYSTVAVWLTSPTDGDTFPPGTNLTLSAEVLTCDTPIDRVEFYSGRTLLGTDSTSPYSLVWSNVPSGQYSLTAKVSDTNGVNITSSPVKITVNEPPTVTLTAPQANWHFTEPAEIHLFATATDSDGYIPQVQFFNGTNLLGTCTTVPYTFAWSNVAAGTYNLTASAFDNLGAISVSTNVSITVEAATNETLTVKITSPTTNASFAVRTNVMISAAASSSSHTITRIEFYSDGTYLGSATNSPYNFTWIDATAGDHYLTAVAVDSTGFALCSSPVFIHVEWQITTPQSYFSLSATDLQIPLAGLPINLTRVYDTRDLSTGDFGIAWRLDADSVKLQQSGGMLGDGWKGTRSGSLNYGLAETVKHLITITLPGGQSFQFSPVASFQGYGQYLTGTSPPLEQDIVQVDFEPLPGTYGTLEATDGVGLLIPTAAIWEGSMDLEFDGDDGRAVYNPTSFLFTASDGKNYEFINGSLVSIVDLNGNGLVFASNGITYTNKLANSLKRVHFARNAQGFITEVYDPLGLNSDGSINGLPVLKYGYDTNNHLMSVSRLVDRANANSYEGNTFKYGSDASHPHHITRVYDLPGKPLLQNQYDAKGRIFQQRDALTNTVNYLFDETRFCFSAKDRLGVSTVQQYDASGRLVSVTKNGVLQSAVTYDAKGRKASETDSSGATSTFAYDDNDRLIATTNALGQVTSQTYADYDRPASSTDARGFAPVNEYDAHGNLTKVTQVVHLAGSATPTTNVTAYVYDTVGNQIAVTNSLTDPNFLTWTTNGYNQFGWMTNTVNARGVETRYEYDANGNRTNETIVTTNANYGLVSTTSYYDAQNRMIMTIDPLGNTNLTFYNSLGKQSQTVDKLNRTTQFLYDALGRLTNTVHPDGLGEFSSYDAEGRRTNSVDRAGQSTTYAYDNMGRLARTILPDGTTNGWSVYDAAGRVQASYDARGNATTYRYDALGRREAVTNALLQVSWYGYDANGNQVVFTNALGNVVTNEFDELNRITKTVHLDANGTALATNRTVYDVLGRRSQEIDAAGVVTAFGYDTLGRLTSVTNDFGGTTSVVTTYAYDELGNQINQVTYARNASQITTYTYDKLGRRISRELPQSTPEHPQIEYYAYNAANLIARTNFNGAVLTFTNDNMGRLKARFYPDSTSVTFDYDALGRRTNMVDASGTNSYAYNARGWLTNRTIKFAGQVPSVTLSYTYDIAGSLLSIKSSNTNGVWFTNSWDELSRLATVTDLNLGTTTYGYDALGNLQTVLGPNGVTNTYQYDALNRLTNLAAQHATNGTLATFAYAVGVAGNRTNLVESIGAQGRTNRWQYDPLYRLTNEVIIASGGANGSVGYLYDEVGNRTNRTSTVTGLTNQTFSYSANDWLDSDGYDANGNTTNSVKGADTYDYENRLIRRETSTNVIEIAYDGDGNRVRKRVITGGETNTVWFLVDDRNLTGYAQVLEEMQLVSGQLASTRVYSYGHDLIAQEQLINTAWVASFYGYDGHGSVRYLTDASGVITDTYAYDAYGILTDQTPGGGGATPNLYLYTGEQFDPELGFYYLRARYSNPQTGRFWTMDSFEGDTDSPRTLHKYIYCYVNPVDGTDPSGHLGLFKYTREFGDEAHRVIENEYKAGHSGAIVGTTTGILGTGLKPDIFDPGNGTFQEIKPLSLSGTFKGAAQILKYELAFRALGLPYSRGAWPDEPSETVVFTTPIVYFNVLGVIFYTDMVDNLDEIAGIGSFVLAREFIRKGLVQRTMLGALGRTPGLVTARGQIDSGRFQIDMGTASFFASAGVL